MQVTNSETLSVEDNHIVAVLFLSTEDEFKVNDMVKKRWLDSLTNLFSSLFPIIRVDKDSAIYNRLQRLYSRPLPLVLVYKNGLPARVFKNPINSVELTKLQVEHLKNFNL